MKAARVWRGVRKGRFPHGVDLRFVRKDARGKNEARVFSCSFSPFQETDGAVLFSFRDVTDERTIALELANRFGCNLCIVGRSAEPDDEAEETRALTEPAALKAALMKS